MSSSSIASTIIEEFPQFPFRTEHKGVTYQCDQCDVLPFKYSDCLKKHKASEHEESIKTSY